jgi:nucleoside 2-deoxyribosyltransferase
MGKVRKWQLEFEEQYPNITLLNPFYEGQYPEKERVEEILKKSKHKRLNKKQSSWIINNDVNSICNTDGIVAIVDGNQSYGTIQEIVYGYTLNKPVFIIATNKYAYGHPWLIFHSIKMFNSFEKFETFCKKYKDLNIK